MGGPRTPWLRWLRPVGAPVLVAAGTIGLLVPLPRESASEQATAHVLRQLLRYRVVAATVHLANEAPLRTRCRTLPRRRELVEIAGERALLVSGLTVKRVDKTRVYDSRLVSIAYLAGCPRLLVLSAGRALVKRQSIDMRRTREGGRAVRRIQWKTPPVTIGLLLDPKTSALLGVRLRRPAIRGTSSTMVESTPY